MSTSTPVLPSIKIADVPADLPQPIKGQIAVIKAFTVGEPNANGNRRVSVELGYTDPVRSTDQTVYLNWFLKDEFFEPDYAARVKGGQVSEKDAISYRMNFQRTSRTFFKALGMETIDLADQSIAGRAIVFSAKAKEDSFLKKGYRWEVTNFSQAK